MKNKHLFFLLFFLFSITISQQNIWYGFSVTNSDNLDAININPAGLGVNRGNQYAINIQQTANPDDLVNNSNINRLSFAQRFGFGLAFQHEYDEINKYKGTIGYGTKIFNNFFIGASFKNKDYATGFLYRPINAISTGLVYYSNKDDEFRHVKYGISFKPFNFSNKQKFKKSNFINYSNLTFGYDKLTSYDENFTSEKYTEYYFLSFDIVPGMNIGFQKYPNSYALNLSVNFGNGGFHITTYPSNPFYYTSDEENPFNADLTYSGVGYFHYSQKKESKLDVSGFTKNNYVELELEGYFIEEKPISNPFDILIENLSPFNNKKLKSIQLRTFIDNINKLSYNKNIDGLIIKLGTIQGGMAKRKEIFDALINFKNQGKKIIVYCNKNIISNNDYYTISMADKIYTGHYTGIDLKGINMEVLFIKGLLDSIYITPEVIRVSEYKTAADIILNNELSDAAKENYGQLSNSIFETMVNDISNAKKWNKDETISKINNGPYYLSSEAIKEDIIDDTMYLDEFESYIQKNKYNVIKWNNITTNEYYVDEWATQNIPKIAVIYAVGGITSGKSNPGYKGSTIMGDKTIIKAIKKARNDKSIKAIVLRVDSGGGSALASDAIWREVRRTTDPNSKNKKPVIVSMSDVAASGGYYISCEADEIIANPMTITGSIGVIWARLNFKYLLNKIGINYDTITKGDNADFGSPTHLLTDNEKEKIYNSIMTLYKDFKTKVINGRDSLNNIDKLDNIANGRVWSGSDAKDNHLVDKQGGLDDAINRAKEISNIKNDSEINIVEFPKSKSFSFFNLFKNKNETSLIKLNDIFPEDLANKLQILDLVPILMDNNIQLLMPYKINLN